MAGDKGGRPGTTQIAESIKYNLNEKKENSRESSQGGTSELWPKCPDALRWPPACPATGSSAISRWPGLEEPLSCRGAQPPPATPYWRPCQCPQHPERPGPSALRPSPGLCGGRCFLTRCGVRCPECHFGGCSLQGPAGPAPCGVGRLAVEASRRAALGTDHLLPPGPRPPALVPSSLDGAWPLVELRRGPPGPAGQVMLAVRSLLLSRLLRETLWL